MHQFQPQNLMVADKALNHRGKKPAEDQRYQHPSLLLLHCSSIVSASPAVRNRDLVPCDVSIWPLPRRHHPLHTLQGQPIFA
jgi:hypothetical protein